MSGDHNMNQFTYGKAIPGANQAQRTTGIHEQKYFDTGPQPVKGLLPEQEVEAPYRSVVEQQWMSLEGRIDFMANALDTLAQRLAPVMRETPCKTMEESLPCADSPMGRKLENFNSRINALNENILHIIESLEI